MVVFVVMAQLVEWVVQILLPDVGMGSNLTMNIFFSTCKMVGVSHPKVFSLAHLWIAIFQFEKKTSHKKGLK